MNDIERKIGSRIHGPELRICYSNLLGRTAEGGLIDISPLIGRLAHRYRLFLPSSKVVIIAFS